MKALKDALPYEFMRGEYDDTPAYEMQDVRVTAVHDTDEWNSPEWPGKHKHIVVWFELENGYAVGWNENPSRGWSFPVIRLRRK